MSNDTWSPAQYERFQQERSQPFMDLLGLLQGPGPGRVVDLGCGTGELTRVLHERTGAEETLGVDSSEAMLARARSLASGGLRFAAGAIEGFTEGGWDVLFSNAALQWVDDHPALFTRLAGLVRPGGQLAVQMPANHDHPSHVVAAEVAAEAPFAEALAGYQRRSPVLAPEAYASLLDGLGFTTQHVRLQVYGHHLSAREEVVEWVRGTLLTDYQKRMPPALFEAFLARYRERLLPQLDARRPYFYPFKRLLLWGRRG